MLILKRSFPMMVAHTIRDSRDKNKTSLISCMNHLNLVNSYNNLSNRVQIGNHKKLIFHNGFSHYQVIRGEKEEIVDFLYKVLNTFGFILKSFIPSGNRKTYMVIIKQPFYAMVVLSIRKSRGKRNKQLISCINYLNLFNSYNNLSTRIQIEKYIS